MARKTGTVKWFSARRGYGFISDEREKDYFVHFSEIQAEGFRKLSSGQQVTFETAVDGQGRELAKEEIRGSRRGDRVVEKSKDIKI